MHHFGNSSAMLGAKLCLLFALTGCGSDRPTVVPVSGRVSIDGEPVTIGRIDFVPAFGPAATARIQPGGTYQLLTFEAGDGAVLGSHAVRVRAVEVADDVSATDIARPQGAASHSDAEPMMRWHVPQRYARADTTPMTAEIVAERHDLDFHLTSEP